MMCAKCLLLKYLLFCVRLSIFRLNIYLVTIQTDYKSALSAGPMEIE